MKWSVFSKLAASVLLLTTAETLVQACGGSEDPYDYYPSFFDNRATAEPAFAPFYYTGYQLFYDDGYWGDDAQKASFLDTAAQTDANLAEWRAYTGASIPFADLDSFIYAYPLADVSALYYNIEKGQAAPLPEPMERNRMTQWFRQSKDLEALGYLMHAKRCEPLAVPQWNDWEPVTRDTAQAGRLIKSGLQLHAAAKKDFFKTRYAYQVLRTAFYAGRHSQTLDLYKTFYPTTEPTGEIGQRIVGLRAGALNRTGRKAEAAYLYSRLFSMNDGRKKSDFTSYDFAGGFENKAAVLKLCKNGSEAATVHVLHGLHAYEQALPHMQAAYAADPTVRGLEVLMAREISKIEERYYRDKILAERDLRGSENYWNRYADYYGGDDPEIAARRAKFSTYAKQLSAFAQPLAQNGARRGFWAISMAYLAFLQDDAAATRAHLEKARAQKLSPREADLLRVVATLAIVRGASPLTADAERELLPNLQWLEGRAAADARMAKSYRDLMGTVLATSYLKARDTVKAVYALARGNTFWSDESGNYKMQYGPDEDFGDLSGALLEAMSNGRLQEVKAYAASRKKSAYDTWLTGGTRTYTPEVLAELEGTKLLRQHRFADAAKAFEASSDAVLKKRMLPNPFHAEIRDWMEPTAGDEPEMDKLAFARRMAQLQKKTDAESRYQYGVGLYSMTYYGKAHRAYDYYRSTSDGAGYYEDANRKKLPQHLQEYYGAYTAEEAFKQTIAATTDTELKARATWMAAKCWQKRCPASPAEYSFQRAEQDYYRYSLRNPYLAQFVAASRTTAFYRDAEETCAWLRDYAAKR